MSDDKLIQSIDHQDWFQNLLEELREIAVEGEFNARWTLVETYHEFGLRILAENDNFERYKVYGSEIVKRIARSIGRSDRTVYNAIAFAKKYPDLALLPEGKNTSWSKICKQLLPANPDSTKPAPIVFEDRELLQKAVMMNMEYLLEYAEPTPKGYKFFIPREKLIDFYEGQMLP
jgi:hypothetical protein